MAITKYSDSINYRPLIHNFLEQLIRRSVEQNYNESFNTIGTEENRVFDFNAYMYEHSHHDCPVCGITCICKEYYSDRFCNHKCGE